ncbi:YjbQ family protein [Chroococcus sp. FPU101]|uniref:YjbQ family protein n=1 Tax=Chroococcus sp. FPU101 TaxID=1974212 RepID=UPI001AA8D74A|nr:YjbQ family protein [Chroococcus sp. FPU101]GFE70053.1 hypothetical protein CFPU101_26630 [Chroococcus sp. FPU101]
MVAAVIIFAIKIRHEIITLDTHQSLEIYNITPKIQDLLATTDIQNGQVLVFSRHTTTAIVINEDEERLLEDIKTYLRKLAPETDKYLHNDLHLRIVPEDEPINAHSHLMAMTLSTSEDISSTLVLH